MNLRITDLNRILKFSIRSKLTIAFVGLSTLSLLIVGLYIIRMHTRSLQDSQLLHLERDVLVLQERTAAFLSNVEGDVRFLSQSLAFPTLAEGKGDGVLRQTVVEQVAAFAQAKGIYYQIWCADREGQAVLNVRWKGDHYAALAQEELERIGAHYYLQLIEGLKPGQFAVAPVELTGDQELVAAISYALPIFGQSGAFAGIVVADVFARDFFQVIEQSYANLEGKIILVSQEGYYLYHPDKKREWSKLLASRHEDTLQRDYPPAVTAAILSGKAGTVFSSESVIAYAPLLDHGPTIYTIFESIPKATIFAPVASFKRFFSSFFILFVGVSAILAYFASNQFTRPIRRLQEGAEVIAAGNFGHRLRTETYDELEHLAEALNRMAGSLQDREARIRRHESELEELVTERTRELSEEKGRLQAILDNVPSAFVMLDPDLTIRSASAAFERITGRALEQVRGRKCYDLFWGEKACANCSAQQAMQSGQIVLDIEQVAGQAGDARYLERVAIPIRVDGRIERILEVITDVTERKRIEAQMIRAQKLAVVGEMASVIAHEVRNSLTSVKMILQLEMERQDLSGADREALEVAAGSIRRMESMVSDLLKFARTTPPACAPHDLNRIVEEGTVLAQYQLNQNGVRIVCRLAPDLSVVMADESHLKEAFINLILNAAAAVTEAGEVVVETRQRDAEVEVTVADDGCGIPETHLGRVFDPFFTTRPEGTGLGLSIVRRTVEQHGGTISVESREGQGSRFTVRLPASKEHGCS
jgi:PAS domain S-box-containing protein